MSSNSKHPLSWDEVLEASRPIVCGILNVTPDSFSDGGEYDNLDSIELKIQSLIDDGARIIDVGAESTRPNAKEVSVNEQMERLENVFNVLKKKKYDSVLFSIDTRSSHVARTAIENGFSIVNDVSGGMFDQNMAEVVARLEALVILMHSRGTPETMLNLSNYDNIIEDVCRELSEMVETFQLAGTLKSRIMVDPGIGFAKTPEQGIEILDAIEIFKAKMGLPVMVGISRKTIVSYMMSGDPSAVPFSQRDEVSAEMASSLASRGVDALRVHNVNKTFDSLRSA